MTITDIKKKQIWDKVLELLKPTLPEVVYNTFYAETKLKDIQNNFAIISVPTLFVKQVLTPNQANIEAKLSDVMETTLTCKILLESEIASNFEPAPFEQLKKTSSGVIPKFTFDNFVVGQCNKESHAASLACAITPGMFYNPLFIYGPSGLGKTHLLNAIGNYVLTNTPEKKVIYTSCVDFVNDFIGSIKEGKTDLFNIRYRTCDILLIDDIQFLAGKEKSHEAFFHIFNDLINNRKQIVITSDRHPEELNNLEERLVSRFASGLSVSIDTPEFETILKILEKKIEAFSFDKNFIDQEVLNYIATRNAHDIRRLEGDLNRLLFYSIDFCSSKYINMKIALEAFKGMETKIASKEDLSANQIKTVICNYYGLTKNQLVSKSRTSNIATARHIAMYMCRKHLDLPYAKIGEEFGKRDHSTVLSACDKIEKALKKDDAMKKACTQIEKILKK